MPFVKLPYRLSHYFSAIPHFYLFAFCQVLYVSCRNGMCYYLWIYLLLSIERKKITMIYYYSGWLMKASNKTAQGSYQFAWYACGSSSCYPIERRFISKLVTKSRDSYDFVSFKQRNFFSLWSDPNRLSGFSDLMWQNQYQTSEFHILCTRPTSTVVRCSQHELAFWRE